VGLDGDPTSEACARTHEGRGRKSQNPQGRPDVQLAFCRWQFAPAPPAWRPLRRRGESESATLGSTASVFILGVDVEPNVAKVTRSEVASTHAFFGPLLATSASFLGPVSGSYRVWDDRDAQIASEAGRRGSTCVRGRRPSRSRSPVRGKPRTQDRLPRTNTGY